MEAVTYKNPFEVRVEETESPVVEQPTDAVVRVTSAAICGSDLHMYEGRTAAKPGLIFGHEVMGVIEEAGDAVTSLKPGDRVVLPFNVACGFCLNCTRGNMHACLMTNPSGVGSAYGYVDMGPHHGGQTAFVRVPFADYNCLKLPGQPGDALEHDFMMLADIFPTAWHATELAMVKAGTTVAIFGAGPVGLLSAYSSILKGASEVYCVDHVPERLERARLIGATPINFAEGDPVDQIIRMRKRNQGLQQALRAGEEKMAGVMCGIDAVGYEAISRKQGIEDPIDPMHQDPTQVINDLVRLVNPTGAIGIIGVFLPEDPRGQDENAKRGMYLMPLGEIFHKGITIGCGQAPVKRYNEYLRDLIIAGKARPSFIISHRLPISEAPDAYMKFDRRVEGYTKVILAPQPV